LSNSKADPKANTAPKASPEKKGNSLQTLDRALELLQVFAKAQTPLTVIELSRLLKTNRTTIYAMINSLLDGEFIERDTFPGRYVLGYKMYELGSMYRKRHSFLRNVRYHALPLVKKWDVSIRISVYIRGGFALLLAEEYDSIIPALNEGTLMPAHATASGKVLLSGLSPEELDRELNEADLEAYTPTTIVNRDDLRAHIEQVRQDGYSLDHEEYLLGYSCIGVPIKDSAGRVIASVTVSGAPEAMEKNREGILKDALILARAIARN